MTMTDKEANRIYCCIGMFAVIVFGWCLSAFQWAEGASLNSQAQYPVFAIISKLVMVLGVIGFAIACIKLSKEKYR